MLNSEMLYAVCDGDSLVIVTREPWRCVKCDTMHYWFVNRMGRTLCVFCASKEAGGKGYDE